jgi:hypothetical protein
VFSGGFSSWRLVGCADEDPARSSIFQQKCRHEAIDTRLEWYVDVDVDWVSERDGCDSRNEPLSLVEESWCPITNSHWGGELGSDSA